MDRGPPPTYLVPKCSWVVPRLASSRLSCGVTLLSGMLGSCGGQLRPAPEVHGTRRGHLLERELSPTA